MFAKPHMTAIKKQSNKVYIATLKKKKICLYKKPNLGSIIVPEGDLEKWTAHLQQKWQIQTEGPSRAAFLLFKPLHSDS